MSNVEENHKDSTKLLVEVCTPLPLGPTSDEMVEKANQSPGGIIDYPWHGITLRCKVVSQPG